LLIYLRVATVVQLIVVDVIRRLSIVLSEIAAALAKAIDVDAQALRDKEEEEKSEHFKIKCVQKLGFF
jgi:hypothetical protein